jgi:tRNA(Ile)-lysidine synthase
VAVSGGSDSTGLLAALSRVSDPGRIVALTVDHGLRRDSAAEAKDVAALAKRLGVRHQILPWLGHKPDTGIQAAAREARHRLLADAARRQGLAAIVTAHTAGDQAETLAMRRARSEGGEGLTGIPPATLVGESVWVLRPFLHLSRAAIRDYLKKSGLGWIDDPSNSDTRFERVRVRGESPAAEPQSARWQARTESAERAAAALFARARREETSDLFHFDLAGLDRAVALDCLRALVDMAGGRPRGLDRHGLARLSDYLDRPDIARLTVGRTLVHRRGEKVTLRRERRNVAPEHLEPGRTILWDGRYRIENRSDRNALSVEGGGEYGISPDLRAIEGRHPVDRDAVEITRQCGRASGLMPVFDAMRGEALAALAGRSGFAPCPWTDWMQVADPI